MKKMILLLIVIVAFISCSKDDESKTTYAITNDTEFLETSIQYLNGTMYEVIVFHYIGDNIVKQDNISQINSGGGKTQRFDVDDNVELLQVSFKMLPPESQYYSSSINFRNYVVAKTSIKKGKHHSIVITGETMVTKYPSKIPIALTKCIESFKAPE